MKKFYKILFCIPGLFLASSCADYEQAVFPVEKPESVIFQERLNAYDDLKKYIDREANPNFKLGAGVSMSEYLDQGVMYRLINRNFDEVTAGYGMKHGAVVKADGSIDTAQVAAFLELVNESGLSVYGHTLVWHANQNAEYLNSTIAPVVLPPTGGGGPSWDEVISFDFESEENAASYVGNAGAVLSYTADGEGANGEGRALIVNNAEVRAEEWGSQLFVSFTPPMAEAGEQYELSIDVRADAAATVGTQAQSAPGAYIHWDFFPAVNFSTEWQTYSGKYVVTETTAGTATIAFNLGKTATNYYFDNLKLTKYNEDGGGSGSAGTVEIANFETEEIGTTVTMTNGGSGTVVDDPKGESGKVLNVVGAQSHPQFTVTMPDGVTLGDATSITLDFLGTGATGMYGQGMRVSINGGELKPFDSPATFGATDDTWLRGKIILPVENLGLTEAQKNLNTFTLAVGSATGSGNYYIDNIVLDWVVSGDLIIEKTPEEKEEIIANELERWISAMMKVGDGYVHAWDVVNEPMDDGNPAELKTGEGKDLAADEFYWQDYLGKDYAVMAFNLAREYGNEDDILFINDYNLEYNLDKTRGLIDYVEYIESKGATVDGIGTQMHIDTNSDKGKIEEMFKLLAATGKLIKISELDMGIGGTKTNEATLEDYQAQEEMYEFVIEKYFELIPADQRYGITIWSPTDSPEGSSWRAGEPIGLWQEDLDRKPAYEGVVHGLSDVEDEGVTEE